MQAQVQSSSKNRGIDHIKKSSNIFTFINSLAKKIFFTNKVNNIYKSLSYQDIYLFYSLILSVVYFSLIPIRVG